MTRDRHDANRAELRAAMFFGVSTLSSVGLAIVYWRGGQTQAEGLLLAAMCGGIGLGIVTWAKHAMPDEQVTEERLSVASSEQEVEAFTEDFEAGERHIDRRRLLVAAAGSAITTFALALLFPLRSLGPRPGKGLRHTAYAEGGLRLVTEDGKPITVHDLAENGVVTVWPEGHTADADAPTLLIRTNSDQVMKPRPGREAWTVNGVVAYSKLCTHVGCPVGLYQADVGLLLCPCHQSTFDVLDGARPVFGPAARSLPQLPLALNARGEFVATADFDSPVGPGYWDRDR